MFGRDKVVHDSEPEFDIPTYNITASVLSFCSLKVGACVLVSDPVLELVWLRRQILLLFVWRRHIF